MKASEIRALSRLVDRMDYYRLLRVERSAQASRIREAYHRARREFHPDAYLGAESELREHVDRIARRITEAYVALRQPASRSSYDKALERGELRLSNERAAEPPSAGGRTPNGRRFYAQCLSEQRAGNLPKALSCLKMALTFEPDNAGFRELLQRLETKP